MIEGMYYKGSIFYLIGSSLFGIENTIGKRYSWCIQLILLGSQRIIAFDSGNIRWGIQSIPSQCNANSKLSSIGKKHTSSIGENTQVSTHCKQLKMSWKMWLIDYTAHNWKVLHYREGINAYLRNWRDIHWYRYCITTHWGRRGILVWITGMGGSTDSLKNRAESTQGIDLPCHILCSSMWQAYKVGRLYRCLNKSDHLMAKLGSLGISYSQDSFLLHTHYSSLFHRRYSTWQYFYNHCIDFYRGSTLWSNQSTELSCNSHTNPHKMRRNYTLGYHLSSIFVCKSGRYCLFYIQSSFQRKRHSRKGFLKCSSSIHWKRIGRIRENKSGSYLGGCRWGSLA